jgi:cytoskeletal protein CcmA (bactofilin family)
LFASGSTLNIDGEVNGDVFCAGQTVTISGIVHGDVMCVGQTIDIAGAVDGNVRLAGQTVKLNSVVAGSATIGAQTFTLSPNGKIGRDMTLGVADSALDGTIGRDLAVGGENVTIAGFVGRNINGELTQLSLHDSARIGGNIEISSDNSIQKSQGARVEGKTTRSDRPQRSVSSRGTVFGLGVWWFLYWFLAILLLAWAVSLLIPGVLTRASNLARSHNIRMVFVGLIASIIIPILTIILFISGVGAPLGLLLTFVWASAVILSFPFFGYFIGSLFIRDSRNSFVISVCGVGVLLVGLYIPFIGPLVFMVSLWMGTGMFFSEMGRVSGNPTLGRILGVGTAPKTSADGSMKNIVKSKT